MWNSTRAIDYTFTHSFVVIVFVVFFVFSSHMYRLKEIYIGKLCVGWVNVWMIEKVYVCVRIRFQQKKRFPRERKRQQQKLITEKWRWRRIRVGKIEMMYLQAEPLQVLDLCLSLSLSLSNVCVMMVLNSCWTQTFPLCVLFCGFLCSSKASKEAVVRETMVGWLLISWLNMVLTSLKLLSNESSFFYSHYSLLKKQKCVCMNVFQKS